MNLNAIGGFPHKPGSPIWISQTVANGRKGPWCWDTEQGCDLSQKIAMGIIPALIIFAIIGGIFFTRDK